MLSLKKCKNKKAYEVNKLNIWIILLVEEEIMKEKFYHCPICGNKFAVIVDSGITPICCGQEMELINPNSVDASNEKHVPEVIVKDDVCHVEVGAVPHPMLKEHHIEWILVVTNKGRHRILLDETVPAVVDIPLAKGEKVLRVYEYCNLHGLWVKEL